MNKTIKWSFAILVAPFVLASAFSKLPSHTQNVIAPPAQAGQPDPLASAYRVCVAGAVGTFGVRPMAVQTFAAVALPDGTYRIPLTIRDGGQRYGTSCVMQKKPDGSWVQENAFGF